MASAAISQRTVSGTVNDDTGNPLIGASVVVKDNPTVGTITDLDGNFKLKLDANAKVLLVSFIGFTPMEYELGASDDISITMTSGVQLEDVVVTALGASREKKSLGYATQEVKGDELSQLAKDNIINTLAGKSAGVQVKNNTNMGGSSNIIIRGFKSLTGDNQALFVVDGIPVNNSTGNDSGQRTGRSGYDYGNAASDINPNDVESVNVLKGAAATALYGSRAANGVIMITTKKGIKGKKGIGFEYNTAYTVGVIDKSTFPAYQNEYGAGYGDYYSDHRLYPDLEYNVVGSDTIFNTPFTEDASYGAKFDPNLKVLQWEYFDPSSPNYGKLTPWIAAENGPLSFFNNSNTFNNNFAFSGATDKGLFRLSYTRFDQTGIMPNSKLTKNDIMLNSSYDITSKFKVSALANFINTGAKGRNSTGYSDNILTSFRQWYQTNVDIQHQKSAYEATKQNITWNRSSKDDGYPIYWDNPYWVRYENYESDGRNRLIGNVKIDYNIFKGLNFMARYSMDSYTELREERKAVGSVAGELGLGRPDVTSGYARLNRNFTETNFDMNLTYNVNITNDFNLEAMLGSNILRNTFSSIYSSTNSGINVPRLYSISNSRSDILVPIESYERIGVNGIFGRLSLGYQGFLYLESTMRRDESSTLPVDNRVYYYPSVSTSFVLSHFLKFDALDLAKIRLNYAEVGASAPWGALSETYVNNPLFDGNPLYFVPSTKQNPNLKPERTKSYEAGLELSFLKKRVGLDLSYYKMNTVDQIMPVRVSSATGYSSKYFNAGEIENKGVEVVFSLVPVRLPNFEWTINLNWSKNNNKVVALYDNPETGIKIENLQIGALQGGVTINARLNEAYGTIQGTNFVFDDNGNRIITTAGYYSKTSTSDQVLGDINPDWIGGFNNSFKFFKNFNLSFLIDFQKGGDVFSLDRWYGEGTGMYDNTVGLNELGNPMRDKIVKNPDGTYAANSGGILLEGVQKKADGTFVANTVRGRADYYAGVFGWARNPNALYVYDASFTKLRELTFGYNLPKSMFGNSFIQGATISFVGGNLWIIHKNLPDADPEASQGAGNIQGWQSGVMPSLKTYGLNLKLQF
jgi:TonB-linked SusC/RagA family outer membrane protein